MISFCFEFQRSYPKFCFFFRLGNLILGCLCLKMELFYFIFYFEIGVLIYFFFIWDWSFFDLFYFLFWDLFYFLFFILRLGQVFWLAWHSNSSFTNNCVISIFGVHNEIMYLSFFCSFDNFLYKKKKKSDVNSGQINPLLKIWPRQWHLFFRNGYSP